MLAIAQGSGQGRGARYAGTRAKVEARAALEPTEELGR